jgi:hypothetical protein
MDAGPSIHPTDETLRAYVFGELEDASAQVVSNHLEDCPDCRRQSIGMSPEGFLGFHRDAQKGYEPSSFGSPLPGGAATEATVADGAVVASASDPCMSSTGQPDPTSAGLDRQGETSLQSGTRIGYFGDYELLTVLGEGGMGIVYKARQLSLDRPVAVKMIRASRFPSADDVRRFQNEAEAVARLDHPNIVPVFEVGQYEDQHYFSMKLITGESLDQRSKAYLDNPRRAAKIVALTASAIHHAHQRGILHRDLKPANILVDADGEPHVTDFGLAKRVEGDIELTRSGAILGTPAYMAPEQTSGKRGTVTTVTDVYGLGALLYVLLTGVAPFGGDSVIATLEQVRERLPERPRNRNPLVPRDLEVICLKCLEKDPRRRYSSADALGSDLDRWLAGEPIAARPVGNATRAWMWCRRNPVMTTFVALLVTVLIAVTTGTLISVNLTVSRILRDQIHQRLRTVATDRQTMLASTLRQYEERATRFARRNRLHQLLMRRANGTLTPDEFRREAENFLSAAMTTTAGVLAMWVEDDAGRVIASSGPEKWVAAFARLERTDETPDGGLVVPPRRVDDVFGMVFSAAVRDRATLGRVVLLTDFAPIGSILLDPSGLGETGEVLVGIGDGEKISLILPLRTSSPVTEVPASAFPAFSAATAGEFGFTHTTDYRGHDVLVAFQPVGSVYKKWGLVAKIDSDEAYKPLVGLRWLLLVVGAFALTLGLIALALGFMVSNAIVSRFEWNMRHRSQPEDMKTNKDTRR